MASEPAPDPGIMSPEAVDGKLKELGEVVGVCIAQWSVADRDVPDFDEAEEPALEPRPEPRWPDPEHALRYAQWKLASNRLSGRAEMARDFAAWWADAATVAMIAAVSGTGVHPVRFNAGNPSRLMFDDELDRLSGIDDDGGYVVFEDGDPVRRRAQLWGEEWADHQVPRLSSVEELIDLLTERGLRVDRVAAVGQAREAVADALAARKRALAGAADNEETLWDQAEQLTELLADYAQLVTSLLPVIRSTATD